MEHGVSGGTCPSPLLLGGALLTLKFGKHTASSLVKSSMGVSLFKRPPKKELVVFLLDSR